MDQFLIDGESYTDHANGPFARAIRPDSVAPALPNHSSEL